MLADRPAATASAPGTAGRRSERKFVLDWCDRKSLPICAPADPLVTRKALDSPKLKLDGTTAVSIVNYFQCGTSPRCPGAAAPTFLGLGTTGRRGPAEAVGLDRSGCQSCPSAAEGFSATRGPGPGSAAVCTYSGQAHDDRGIQETAQQGHAARAHSAGAGRHAPPAHRDIRTGLDMPSVPRQPKRTSTGHRIRRTAATGTESRAPAASTHGSSAGDRPSTPSRSPHESPTRGRQHAESCGIKWYMTPILANGPRSAHK